MDILVRELAQARLDAQFLNIYRLIFGSQIKFLKTIRASGGHLSLEKASSFFHMVKVDEVAHEEGTLKEYVDFLVRFGLVTEIDNGYSITDIGNDFLLFLHRAAFSEDKPL